MFAEEGLDAPSLLFLPEDLLVEIASQLDFGMCAVWSLPAKTCAMLCQDTVAGHARGDST